MTPYIHKSIKLKRILELFFIQRAIALFTMLEELYETLELSWRANDEVLVDEGYGG